MSDGPSDDALARYVKELEERRGHDERPAPRVSPRERLFHVALLAVIAAVILLMKVVSALSGSCGCNEELSHSDPSGRCVSWSQLEDVCGADRRRRAA